MAEIVVTAADLEQRKAIGPLSDGRAGYRLFHLNNADKFTGVDVLEAHSDSEAIERARSILAHHPYSVAIEVWERHRLVARIDRQFPKAPGVP
jgi:hypothetical protein